MEDDEPTDAVRWRVQAGDEVIRGSNPLLCWTSNKSHDIISTFRYRGCKEEGKEVVTNLGNNLIY